MPYINLPSSNIYYEERGTGTPLLLLHGLGGSSKDWEFNAQYLENDHRLFMVDIPSFGNSSMEGDYSIPALARSISQAIHTLGIEHINIVGFSFGGAIALELITHPEKYDITIDKLVLFSSQPCYTLSGLKQVAEYYFRVCLVKLFGLPALSSVIAKRLFPASDQSALRDYVEKGLRTNGTTSYLSALRALTRWSVDDKLNGLTNDIRVVAAENDYASLDSKGYVDQIAYAELSFIEDCGHAIPLEKPKLAASLISTHLKSE